MFEWRFVKGEYGKLSIQAEKLRVVCMVPGAPRVVSHLRILPHRTSG